MSRPRYIRFLSRAAPLYDPVANGMGFPKLWETFAAIAAPERGLSCLDVCTGTGGVALALARRGARVVGVDAAPGMLVRAERKARGQGLAGKIRLVRMDARALGFRDDSIPLVTCSMALHEMAEDERDRVLAELGRVSSPHVLVADYRVPPGRRAGWLFRARRFYEYLESDDFEGYAGWDPAARLAAAELRVQTPRDVGAYRIWPCRVTKPRPSPLLPRPHHPAVAKRVVAPTPRHV
ncbi:MAG: class I SAM-dependent methyltransferase [Myxococcota bacterium]